ncbi:hypothetical protein V6N13_059615 [Hibiscus sabdariffa]
MVPPNSAQPAESETTEFGPWMLVAKRQRRPARMPQSSSPRHVEKQPLGSRFNLISELREDAMGFGEDHAHRRLSVAMESATIPRQQGRATTDARHQRAIPVRKPLTIVDFSIVSRAAPKAGSSRANLGKISSVVLEKSRHLAVVISENSNPSCPAMEVDHVAPTTSHNSLTRGKSLDSCANLPIGSSMGPLNVVHSDPAATMVPKPGCGHPKFCQTVRQYLRDCRPDIVVFVEPHISGRKADYLIASLGFPYSHRIEANGFSGRIWIVWFDSFKVDILLNHFQFVHCCITDKRCGSSTLATVVYGSPNATKRKALWSNLRHLASSIRQPPLLLHVNGNARHSFKPPFWYLSSWSSHDDFSQMVADNWVPSATLSETIISFTKAADTWNDTVYGRIGKKKRIVMARQIPAAFVKEIIVSERVAEGTQFSATIRLKSSWEDQLDKYRNGGLKE